MLRIQFKWFNPRPPVIEGMVTVSDVHQIIGGWQITVNPVGITHFMAHSYIHLPPICGDRDLMRRVEDAAHAYYDGLMQEEASGFWMEKPDPKEEPKKVRDKTGFIGFCVDSNHGFDKSCKDPENGCLCWKDCYDKLAPIDAVHNH